MLLCWIKRTAGLKRVVADLPIRSDWQNLTLYSRQLDFTAFQQLDNTARGKVWLM